MDDIAAARNDRALDDLILEVGIELAILDEQIEQVLDVLRVHLAGMDRHGAGQVELAHDLDAIVLDGLAGSGQLDIAAGLRGEIDDDRPRSHALDRLLRDQARRRAARNRRRGDDDVGLGGMVGEDLLLLAQVSAETSLA